LEVRPLLLELLMIGRGQTLLDLGTGTGWVLDEIRSSGAVGIGVEVNAVLAHAASRFGAVVVGRLPDLSWFVEGSFDAVSAVLVLEHISDLDSLFAESARVTRPGGTLTLVINHPQITAPGSAPVVDPVDGEVFWRWGSYLDSGSTEEPAGDGTVTFHHRTMAELLNAAAAAGWCLERAIETGLSDELVDGDPLLELQQGLPRLLGVRWRRN
jgi:SAM-dependent methyltransferase